MHARLRKQWDALRASYWFVPALMVAGAVGLWAVTNAVDLRLGLLGGSPVAWLYDDEIESARTLLFAVAGATVGIVGVVFSITMVPLTIAASQFGPRLLRTFLRDTGTQITLGMFEATFIFCMLVLFRLRDGAAQTLPQLSVTVGLLLALASCVVLIYFINHVAVSVQAPIVAAEVSAELLAAINRELPALATEERAAAPPDFASDARPVLASASGYVQARDDTALLRLASEHGLVVQTLKQPGDFVTQATALALIAPQAQSSDEINAALTAAFLLGPQRTLVQDLVFGINELVEMALRALSPAINDPFTALTCLDWIGAALCRACGRSFPPAVRCDEHGQPRLLTSPLTFTQLCDAAFDMIREYGRTSTVVTLRMLDTLLVVAQCARTQEQRGALLRHAVRVEQASVIGLPEAADRALVAARAQAVRQVLALDAHDRAAT